ncbi:MAG TPA: hypothetical protein VFS05_03435 [Gemmatimonadaceae bacterium]|nr:hypothetical protein [Gemmatimonadaceae bacterium]
MPRHTPARARRGRAVLWLVLLLALAGVAVAIVLARRWNREYAAAGGAVARSAPPAKSARPAGASAPAGQRPRGGLFDMAVKPAPVTTTFEGCPPEGDSQRMAEINRLKNRVDTSAAYRLVPLDSLLTLSWPPATPERTPRQWSRADRAAIERRQGIPVAVEGYVAGARLSGTESTNCHGADARYRDWRLWIVARAGESRARSVVTEPTPRVRASHPGWSLDALRDAQRARERVRVSGWLFFDPEHPDQIGKTRGTLWEIHPVTRIEVQRGGRWVSLDRLTTPAATAGR